MTKASESLKSRAPDQGFAGEDFFYSNLRIQEVLTAVRYGIEARRGLIIITGEHGVGKTTVLGKIAAELPDHIIGIEIAPTIGFFDLLQTICCRLSKEEGTEDTVDEAALVRRCQQLLQERLEVCEIVALLIDDAHFMEDRTLRHVMQNFLGGGETANGALLQLVLAGSRGLKTKLSQAALVPLRRRPPMICKLEPLSSNEIGSYIEQALAAGNNRAAVFDERAVKRIALLTDGNPRDVNALYGRALQISGGGAVTAELIETAARDLPRQRVSDSPVEDRSFTVFDDIREADHSQSESSFDFTRRHRAAAEEPAFFSSRKERRRAWLPRGEHITSWVRVATVLVLLIGATAMIPAQAIVNLVNLVVIPAQQAGNVVATWGEELKHIALSEQAPPSSRARTESAEAVSGPSEAEIRKMPEPEALEPLPGPDRPAEPMQMPLPNQLSRGPEAPAAKAPGAERGNKSWPEVTANRTTTPRATVKEIPSRNLQSEVVKAIASRAIMGVEVSVVQGTAILDGHVATERQRRAAERAARSVVGVERVNNRIAITFG